MSGQPGDGLGSFLFLRCGFFAYAPDCSCTADASGLRPVIDHLVVVSETPLLHIVTDGCVAFDFLMTVPAKREPIVRVHFHVTIIYDLYDVMHVSRRICRHHTETHHAALAKRMLRPVSF